jgi:hypothetical protein
VERFAAAYADYDADVFRAEREVMCHAENIYSTCELLQDKLFRYSLSFAKPNRVIGPYFVSLNAEATRRLRWPPS